MNYSARKEGNNDWARVSGFLKAQEKAQKQALKLQAKAQKQTTQRSTRKELTADEVMADYDKWLKVQEAQSFLDSRTPTNNSAESIMADYDNWLAGLKAQEAQKVQKKPAQKVQKEQEQKPIPVLQDNRVFNEQDARKRQAEQVMNNRVFDEESAKKRQAEQEAIVGNKKKVPETDDLVRQFAEANGVSLEEAQRQYDAFTNQGIGTVDQSKQVGKEQAKFLSDSEKADKWLDPSHKMTKAEKKQARQIVTDFNKKYGSNGQLVRTEEEKQAAAKIAALDAKSKVGGSFNAGFYRPILNATNMLYKGADYLLGGSAELGAGMIDDLAGTDLAGAVHNARKSANDQMAQNAQYLRGVYQNAQTQNPLAYGGGNLAGTAAMYMATNPAFDAIGSAAGLGAGGQFLANQVGQNAQDLLLDTLPEYMENTASGMSTEEANKEALKNIGMNAGGNLLMGMLAELIPVLKSQKEAQKKAADEIVQYGRDVLAPLADDADNVVRNADIASLAKPVTQEIPNPLDPATMAKQAAEGVDDLAAQSKQAAETIENLSEQVPKQDIGHELAWRYADSAHNYDPYDYGDSMYSDSGMVEEAAIEEMAKDINEGKDLSGYIESLEEIVDEVDDPAERAEVENLIRELSELNPTKPAEAAQEAAEQVGSGKARIVEDAWNNRKPGDTDRRAIGNMFAVIEEEARAGRLNLSDEDWERLIKAGDEVAKKGKRKSLAVMDEILLKAGAEEVPMQTARIGADPMIAESLDRFDIMANNIREIMGRLDYAGNAKAEKEAGIIEQALQDYEKAINAKDVEAADEASRVLTNARRRFHNAVKDIDGYNGELNTASMGTAIDTPAFHMRKKVGYKSDFEIPDVPEGDRFAHPKGTTWEEYQTARQAVQDRQGAVDVIANEVEKRLPNTPDAGNKYDQFLRAAHKMAVEDTPEAKEALQQAYKEIEGALTEPLPEETVGDAARLLKMDLQYFAKDADDVAKAANMDGVLKDLPEKGNGERKISKYRTNSMEKLDSVTDANAPKEDFGHNVYTVAKQTEDGIERWGKNPNAVRDLQAKEAWDEVDARYAQRRWTELMESGSEEDVKEALRLSRKQSYELREGGRLVQVAAEMDSIASQLNAAKQTLNKKVDSIRGTGTSEALDNLGTKLDNKLDGIDLQTAEGRKKAEEIVSDALGRNMREYAPTNKNMKSKKFKHTDKILDGLRKGKYKNSEELINAIYKQNGGAVISAQDQKKIYDLLNMAKDMADGSREQEIILAKAAKIATKGAPSTFGEKVKAILYMNMLGNFKTAISRNAFGNLMYQGLEQARAPFAAIADRATSLATKQRSSLGWNAGKAKSYASGLWKGTKEQAGDLVSGLTRGELTSTGRSGELGWANALKNNRYTFNEAGSNKVANGLAKIANSAEFYVTNAMKLGDRPFYEANYAQRSTELHQLVDRYGKDAVAGLAGVPDEMLDDVIDMTAAVHAADSVFQKHGEMSKGLTDIRNGLGELSRGILGIDVLSTAASPFTMTPGNILQRTVEYSPLGFLKNGIKTAQEIKAGSFDQKRFVDELSRSTLGLPILGGAYALAKNGYINGGYSEDEDEKAAQIADDFIEYGVKLDPNGTSYDASDLPVIGPFAQAGGAVAEKGVNAESLGQAINAVTMGSTMQGLRKAFGAEGSYSTSGSMLDNLKDTVLSSGTQLIPSLLRQTAQTTDKYKRELGEYKTPEYYLNLIKNSVPGWRETMPIKYDDEGNPILQNQGRPLGDKILENYILPMKRSDYEPSELNQEAKRLKDATDGKTGGYAPKAKRKDLKQWAEKAETEYSEADFRDYKKEYGELKRDVATSVIGSDFYQSLDPNTQVEVLSAVYSGLKQVEKNKLTGLETDDKLAHAYMDGGIDGVMEHLATKYNPYGMNQDAYKKMQEEGADMSKYEGYGEALSSREIEDKKAYREAFASGGEEALDKEVAYQQALSEAGLSDSKTNRAAWEKLSKSEGAIDTMKKLGEIREGSKDENGNLDIASLLDYANKDKTVTKEMLDMLKGSNWTGTFKKNGNSWVYVKKNGATTEGSNSPAGQAKQELENYGLKGDKIVPMLTRAKETIPKLTTAQFAKTYKEIDRDNKNGLSQKEMLAYLNKGSWTDEEANKLWVAYGDDWQKKPVLKNGEWVAVKK